MSTSPTEKRFEVYHSIFPKAIEDSLSFMEQINEPLFHKATPENYMLRSLLAVLLCFPVGIIAFYHSCKVYNYDSFT